MTKKIGECICCGKQGKYSILLATGPNMKPVDVDRIYIPNDGFREMPGMAMGGDEETPFCAECMRKVEDNLRATIMYLQSEHGLLTIKSAKSN